jgi:tetratricopeptide (TPR) repeat protein
MQDRADQLSRDADKVSTELSIASELSNLALQLYSWYIKNGHSRNEEEDMAVQEFFIKGLGDKAGKCKGFYERLYLYQSYCWNAFIKQDFLQYYRYAKKWVDLFEESPYMIEIETGIYIKGMHNLMGAHFNLMNHSKLKEALSAFEKFCGSSIVQNNINNRVQCFIYKTISNFNKHFLEGSFTEGLEIIPEIEKQLKEYELYIDRHRVLVFYYKIACLYFGSGNYEKTIDYLNKIINWKVDLRTDLQCYSRLLHLIAHYELGNEDILDYLIKSVYRFMAKMHNLSVVEEEIFRFIRKSFHLSVRNVKPELEKLLVKLKTQQETRFEARAFIYLDIISWIESKLDNTPVQEILKKKFTRKKITSND